MTTTAITTAAEDLKQFRERLGLVDVASLPETSRRDWVAERPLAAFGGKPGVSPFDFSLLTQKTAKDLAAALSAIESGLFSLRSSSDFHLTAWAE